MPLISATTFPILSVASARLWIVRSVCFTFSTALVAVFDESMIWRVISRIEAASSSVAAATVCTLPEVCSAEAATSTA